MRNSVFEFSQPKLVEYELDVVDAILLNWFSFFFSGKMEKQIFKDENGTKIYGWVKTSKIIEDLPVLGIGSEKGIRRRFDFFVDKGILDRKTVQTQKGKKSYYRTTDVYDSLIYTDSASDSPSLDTVIPQGNSDGLAKNSEHEKQSENPQRTKTTYAKTEKTKKTVKNPQGNFDGLAQGNFDGLAQGNSDGLALNNRLIINNIVNDTVAVCNNLSTEIFGKNAFDKNFGNKAAAFTKKLKINNLQEYFHYIKTKVEAKGNIENPRGLAYTLFFQEDIANEFIHQYLKSVEQLNREKEEERKKIICPVCDTKFLPTNLEECPHCQFEIKYFNDTKEIFFFKNYICMSKERQNEYRKRMMEICQVDIKLFSTLNLEQRELIHSEQNAKIDELKKEFNLV